MRLTKAWTAINRLSVIWKLDLTNKIKCSFFQATIVLILLFGCTTWTLNKWRKSLTATTQECCKQYWGSTPQSSSCTATYHSSWKPSKLDEPDMRRSRDKLISNVLQWTPSHGRAKAGWPTRTYILQLCADTGCSPEDLLEAMDDRERWQERVRYIHADGVTWWWRLHWSHSNDVLA